MYSNVLLLILDASVTRQNNVTYKCIARQRPRNTHDPKLNSGTMGSCNLILGNGLVNTLPRMRNDVTPTGLSYHVKCFL
jgi:hypothetical protein